MQIRRNPAIGYRPNKVARFLRRVDLALDASFSCIAYLYSARKLAVMLYNSISISYIYRELPLHPASSNGRDDALLQYRSCFGHAITLLELRRFHSPQKIHRLTMISINILNIESRNCITSSCWRYSSIGRAFLIIYHHHQGRGRISR